MTSGGERVTSVRQWKTSIPSALAEVDPVCQHVCKILAESGLPGRRFEVDLLLREFLNNAIIHGNRFDTNKKATVSLEIHPESIELHISDEGCGFDWRTTRIPADSTATSGRGLAIGAQFTSHMAFNDCGNQVTLFISLNETKE